MANLPQVKLNNNGKPVLLAVLAHPDDETFGTGGTLALYAMRGVAVHLICATRGEVGEMDPALMGNYASIGDRREAELRCAAGTLGLEGVYFLGYRDSGMTGSPDNQHPESLVASPLDEVAAKIVHYIRLLRPQVVVTFDPIGGYRHPDHIAIHQATVKAFYAAGNAEVYPDPEGCSPYTPDKLYFHTMPRGFLKVAVRMLRLFGRDPSKFGKNHDIDLTSLTNVDFPTNAVVNYRPVAKIRQEAAECHASQGGQTMNRGVQGLLMRLFNQGDTYMRAYPEPRAGEKRERDLFERV